jgi:alpha-glucosidase
MVSMNIVNKIIYTIRAVGLKTIFRTTYYARYRDYLEKKYGVLSKQVSSSTLSPYQLQSIQPFHNGAFFSFNDGLQLEVSFLSTHTVRVTWTPGQLPLGYSVSGDETLALRVSSLQTSKGWELTAGALMVRVTPDGKIEYISGKNIFRTDSPPMYQSPIWTHSANLSEEAVIHGLGQRTRFNLRPGNYRLWNTDPGGNYGLDSDPLYLTVPVFYCRQKGGGYLAFYENTHDGEAGFAQEAKLRFVGGALRFYIIEGELPQTLEEYSRLTGNSPLPPRWALGFHHCRWGYKSSAEVREVLEGFRANDLPLDAFHFDIDYMDEYRVFSVDPVNYPDFDQLCIEMNEQGIHPVIILDPGVKIDPNYGPYYTGLSKQVFCTLPDGEKMRALVWPGWVELPDFSNPVTRTWWGEYYARFLEDGVAGFWHDMNEPAAFAAFGEPTIPRVTAHSLEGRGGNHEEAHNIYGLLMDMAGYDAIRNYQPNKRPWLLTRSGWAGVQRYAWSWTGDVESSWPALKMTVSTVLGLGVSGIPYSGSDIGGFSGNPGAELFIRWFQLSTLMAFFRNHSALTTDRREPWVFGEETTQICRKMLKLRRKLIPYLYSIAWEAHQSGAPLVRPISWLDSSNQALWQVDDMYLLGDKLLVAPVFEPGADSRSVTLPRGGWYHYWDDENYPEPGVVEISTPLNQIPFFVREGSVLPMQESDLLTLHIYFSHHNDIVVSHHYQDAGDGYGVSRLDTFVLRCNGNHLSLEWQKDGNYPLPGKIKLVIHGGFPDLLQIDGREVAWEAETIEIKPFNYLKAIIQ